MKVYLVVCLLVVLFLFTFGFVLPSLVSASSDIAVGLAGLFVVVVIPTFYVAVNFLIKEVKKYVK